eukprot:scaffold1401_cov330-Pavlova_lutheri.AAC.4
MAYLETRPANFVSCRGLPLSAIRWVHPNRIMIYSGFQKEPHWLEAKKRDGAISAAGTHMLP